MSFWTAEFLQALAFVLKREGGFVNNPKDPGGATDRGVTQRTFSAYLRRLGQPDRDVRTMTDEELRAIYWTGYYQPATNGLTGALVLVVFDTAVNMGLTRALQWVFASRRNLDTYLRLRRQEYHHLVAEHPALEEFLMGWLYRLRCLRMACAAAADTALDADYQAERATWLAKHPALQKAA